MVEKVIWWWTAVSGASSPPFVAYSKEKVSGGSIGEPSSSFISSCEGPSLHRANEVIIEKGLRLEITELRVTLPVVGFLSYRLG